MVHFFMIQLPGGVGQMAHKSMIQLPGNVGLMAHIMILLPGGVGLMAHISTLNYMVGISHQIKLQFFKQFK